MFELQLKLTQHDNNSGFFKFISQFNWGGWWC